MPLRRCVAARLPLSINRAIDRTITGQDERGNTQGEKLRQVFGKEDDRPIRIESRVEPPRASLVKIVPGYPVTILTRLVGGVLLRAVSGSGEWPEGYSAVARGWVLK